MKEVGALTSWQRGSLWSRRPRKRACAKGYRTPGLVNVSTCLQNQKERGEGQGKKRGAPSALSKNQVSEKTTTLGKAGEEVPLYVGRGVPCMGGCLLMRISQPQQTVL